MDERRKNLLKQICCLMDKMEPKDWPPGGIENMSIEELECVKTLSEHIIKRNEDKNKIKTYKYVIKLLKECDQDKLSIYDKDKIKEFESMINEYESDYLK